MNLELICVKNEEKTIIGFLSVIKNTTLLTRNKRWCAAVAHPCYGLKVSYHNKGMEAIKWIRSEYENKS